MIQRSSALAITASVVLAAARFLAPSSTTVARAPVAADTGHASMNWYAGAVKHRDYDDCTAYQAAPKPTPRYPNDDNAGSAKGVIDTFFGDRPKAHARYVVALAPDPRHSNLSLMFDREISTIQHAAQEEGYDYNSSWMPWKSDSAAPLPYLADRQHASTLTEERENCPGVILFRKTRDMTLPDAVKKETADGAYENALVVFIVGEQATGGVNEKEWANAITWLSKNVPVRVRNDKNAPDGILRILGPSFSGSFVSLERDVEGAYARDQPLPLRFPQVRILSGSASGCGPVRWFQSSLAQFAGTAKRSMAFGTFQENDALHIFRFLEYVKSQGTDPKDIAILSEDETAYAALGKEIGGGRKADPCDFPYARESRPLHLVYPRDISAIRDAYSKQSVFDSGGSLKERPARSILHETADNAVSGDDITDTVPTFSGETSALAQEAYLYGVVSFLRSHHSRYLVLRCTNPLDFLFLTRFFHRAYPQARIVTTGSDLLFRREIDTTEFRGVLALTAYPLLPSDQHWSRISNDRWNLSPHNHLVFEGQLPEGMYLAMRYLLQGEMLAETTIPLIVPSTDSEKPMILHRAFPAPDYANPFWLSPNGENKIVSPMHPPTWLVTVGRDGYWPVAVLHRELQQKLDWPLNWKFRQKDQIHAAPPSTMVELAPSPAPQEHYEAAAKPDDPNQSAETYTFDSQLLIRLPLPWTIAAIFAILLATYQVCGIWLGVNYVSDGLFAVFERVPGAAQNILQGISCAFALLPLLELAGVGSIPENLEQVSSSQPEIQAMRCLTVLAVWLMLIPLVGRWLILIPPLGEWLLKIPRVERWLPKAKLERQETTQTIEQKIAYIVLSVGAFLVFLDAFRRLLSYGFKNSTSDVNYVPLFYRMAHLTDGVSPLLPVLLLSAGFYLWVWQAMAGNRMLRTGCPSLPETRPQINRFNLFRWVYRWLARWLYRWRKRSVDPVADFPKLDESDARLSERLGERIRLVASPLFLSLRILVGPSVVVFAAWLCFLSPWTRHPDLPLLSLEGRAFNWVINLGLLLALVITAAEASRLYATWIALRKLLHALGRIRLRRTIARLRPIEAHSIWSVSGNVRRFQYGLLVQQLEAANRLRELASPVPAGITSSIAALLPAGIPSAYNKALQDVTDYGGEFTLQAESNDASGAPWDGPIGARPRYMREVLSDAVALVYNLPARGLGGRNRLDRALHR